MSETEVTFLQQAAQLLEEKMREMRESGNVLSIDRVAVIAALNIAHQLLSLEQHATQKMQIVNQQIIDLQNKVESALVRNAQMELPPAR